VPSDIPISTTLASLASHPGSRDGIGEQSIAPSGPTPFPLLLCQTCKTCGERFKDEHRLAKHQADKHAEHLYTCDNTACRGFSTSSLRSFQRHLDTTTVHVTNETPQFWCICKAKESRKDHFRRHLEKKKKPCRNNGQAYKCWCNRLFEDVEELKKHYGPCGRGRRGRPRKERSGSRQERTTAD